MLNTNFMRFFVGLILLFFNLFVSVNESVENYFQTIIYEANFINIYNEGEKYEIYKESEEFKILNSECHNLLIEAREMPALGVSLHDETLKEMQDGLWIEWVFDHEQTHGELPFSALLIKIDKNYSGFNIVRKYNGKYEGRCFYIDLRGKNMSKIQDFLAAII